jgi:hypothetical protein
MDMDMGGMQMGTNMFQTGNMALARDFWYIIAGVVGLLLMVRAVNIYQAQVRFVSPGDFLTIRNQCANSTSTV